MPLKQHCGVLFLLTLAAVGAAFSVEGQSYTFSTLAGNTGYGSTDGPAANSLFYQPAQVAVDGVGNIFVADSANDVIREISSGGTVSTFAGLAGVSGNADGTGSGARFSNPTGIAFDKNGNLYIADAYNYLVRKITPSRVVTTLAGSGLQGSADGTGSAASFSAMQGLAVDANGNVFVADTGNETIRKITPGGVVTTFAGTAKVYGHADGTGAAAQFFYPSGLVFDPSQNLFVADTLNSTIRMITPGGVVTTVAGTAQNYGSQDGTGAAAGFDFPYNITTDNEGTFFIADTDNSAIRQFVLSSGAVTTLAGRPYYQGSLDGPGNEAEFNQPRGVAFLGAGTLAVADWGNNEIRTVTFTSDSSTVSTLAGTASAGSVDGFGNAARFYQPTSVGVDGAGKVYVADTGNDTIRMITPSGTVTTFAGKAGVFGSGNGTGTGATFGEPKGVASDSGGTLYVADTGSQMIRMITPGGVVTTLAGSGEFGSGDGTGSGASFYEPSGVAVDANGFVYVADTGNNTIRKITPGGVVTTLAGMPQTIGHADGTGTGASFYNPMGVAVDSLGFVYVADTQNEIIRKITPGGVVTTWAGTAGVIGSADGTGSVASFYSPSGIAVDGNGNAFVADSGSSTIRKITPGGVVTTIGGAGFTPGSLDGPGTIARFANPTGIAFANNTGNLYIADQANNTIRVGVPASIGLALMPLSFKNTQFTFGAAGPGGLALQVQVSSDLMNWEMLKSFTPFTGSASVTDNFTPGATPRFYRGVLASLPPATAYLGTGLVLVGHVPSGYGSGAIITLTGGSGPSAFIYQVTADANGLYTLELDTSQLPDSETIYMTVSSADGTVVDSEIPVTLSRGYIYSPADETPKNEVTDGYGQVEPDICTCCSCQEGSSLMFFGNSLTPNDPGTELATGKMRARFPIVSFETRKQGFKFELTQASMINYSGPVGYGFSHSYNMMIVQTNGNGGQIITPDLRIFPISSTDGTNWTLPAGFESTLTLSTNLHRWTLTHYSGMQVEFYQGKTGAPGYPVTISDANGNTTSLAYNGSGLLASITTDLGQTETLSYNAFGVLTALTDHIGRTWSFNYDFSNRLTQIVSPVTQYAAVPAGSEVTDATLAGALVTRGRSMTFGYGNGQYPYQITSVTDDRGAIPQAWVYDAQGRVVTNYINGNPEVHIYGPTANPTPLPKLEAANMITRTIDREGNITDYEIHSRAGGPDGGAGQFGLRRKVTWTETGKGNPPLRVGEPAYYEQRLLQDCDCLSPHIVTQPFSSLDVATLTFDSNGIPKNWPRRIYTYNSNRQVTDDLYTDGANDIEAISTYQKNGYGQSGQYSKLLTRSDPRGNDLNPIYLGLDFTHTYQYDSSGNQISHSSPTVTRGTASPQTIVESWSYNSYGQVTSYSDPNHNITRYSYYSGDSAGGDINTAGTFGGYLATITRGAAGSSDAVTSLTTTHKVNALGMVTEMVDPRGLVTDYQYDAMGERVLETDPTVTLWNGQSVRYTESRVFDGAGQTMIVSRTNIDYDGSVGAPGGIAVSMSYDVGKNRLSERRMVDGNHADDLLTLFAYSSNDLRIATQKPLGNREFVTYDERLLPFRTFYGVGVGGPILNHYPASKQATSLTGIGFVGYREDLYDSRGNPIQSRDGLGKVSYSFYDFDNRLVAQSDANGNGTTMSYDAAGNQLTVQSGALSQTSGLATQVLSRSYYRFDEANRGYQTVNDISLSSDEGAQADPSGSGNPSYLNVFDAGSRVVESIDADQNATTYAYDGANRRLWAADALHDVIANSYDADGNVVQVTETETPGTGASGAAQSYITAFAYDENNRQTRSQVLGLNGNSVDDQTFFAYDSRGNTRLVKDADGNVTLTTFDGVSRLVAVQRFDGDPITGTPNEISRTAHVYDGNGNVIEDQTFLSEGSEGLIGVTQYAYDGYDRRVRTIYPDSDNPIDGSNNGPSGIYNRVEITYDAEGDPITVEDPRQVMFANAYDGGRRLTNQSITLVAGVSGVTRQAYGYDARNFVTTAMNNYSSVTRGFDALGRATNETQAIRLDGSGFSNGWEQPVTVNHGYDAAGNNTNLQVAAGTTDLSVTRTVDALNRNQTILSKYFNVSNSLVAKYAYFGPSRIQSKLLGNGAMLTNTYDAKRRTAAMVWNGSTNNLLAGFQYVYDSMDVPKYERWLHDQGDYDHYQYNHRYELTGVTFRSTSATPPASFANSFTYDDNADRSHAVFGGPFAAQTSNTDGYTNNAAGQYLQLTRNSAALDPAYDRAGNMTGVPVLPVSTNPAQEDVTATASWDAMDCLFSVQTGATSQQSYRYDPFRRRIAVLEGTSPTPLRRFIYDNWRTAEERVFNAGATLASAPSRLERIYVDGAQDDEHLLTAIDRDGDGALGPANLNSALTNADQWYYFLPNRLGSVTALLAGGNANQVLEYNRYSAYGEPTVLPAVSGNNNDLSVNFAQGWQRSSPQHGNVFFFTGQRFDDATGLYLYRNRYYEARSGRFLSRDPAGLAPLYSYCMNSPALATDPLGLDFALSDTLKIPSISTGNPALDVFLKLVPSVFFTFTGDCQACANNADPTTIVLGAKSISVGLGVDLGVAFAIKGGVSASANVGLEMATPTINIVKRKRPCKECGEQCVFTAIIHVAFTVTAGASVTLPPLEFKHEYPCPCCSTETTDPLSEGDWQGGLPKPPQRVAPPSSPSTPAPPTPSPGTPSPTPAPSPSPSPAPNPPAPQPPNQPGVVDKVVGWVVGWLINQALK